MKFSGLLVVIRFGAKQTKVYSGSLGNRADRVQIGVGADVY